MKLSLVTTGFIPDVSAQSIDALKICEIAKDNGIEELDITEKELELYGVKNLKSAFESTGVKCGCFITDVAMFSVKEDIGESFDKAVSACRDIGAGMLAITDLKSAEKVKADQKSLDTAVEFLKSAVQKASDYSISVAIENTNCINTPLCSAKSCKYILDKVQGLGYVFNTADFLADDPDCDILNIYEMLKVRIVRVHLGDATVGSFDSGIECSDGRYMNPVIVGAGILKLSKLVEKLATDGFDRTCGIEYVASSDIQADEHGKYLSVYVNNIEAYESGNHIRIPYSEIKGVNKPVSRIFFGTAIMKMVYSGNANSLLDAAYSSGITAFDCARGYGGAEKSLGMWMKERNNRERVVVLSKCGYADKDGKVFITRDVILSDLKKSLEALDTDYIDIYLLHRDNPETPVSEIIDTMNELKKQGKIRAFGGSNWTHQRVAEANRYAEENGLEGFSASSPNYGLARQINDPWGGGCVTVAGPENKEARKWYTDNNVPIIAYSSMGRGFFSGKFKSYDYEGAKKVLDMFAQKGYLYEENMLRLKRVEELAEKYGTNVPDIAMRYVFGGEMNTFAVVSTTNPCRFKGNIKAANNPLSKTDIAFVEAED